MFMYTPTPLPAAEPEDHHKKMHPTRASLREAGRNLMRSLRIRKTTAVTNTMDQSLAGQVIIVTGASSGIGRVVAEDCADRGARVIVACRDTKAGQRAVDQIVACSPNADLAVYHLDLSSFESVKSFGQNIIENEDKVDVLINNAGMMGKERKETEDLHEQVIQVNYFAPVMLTMMLFEFMTDRSADPRIICVSSVTHGFAKEIFLKDMDWKYFPSYHPSQVYAHSKLAVMLFVRELSKRADSRSIRVYAADPGMAMTGISRHVAPKGTVHDKLIKALRPFSRPVKEAAESILSAVMLEKYTHDPAVYYFKDGKVAQVSRAAHNDAKAAELWNLTKELLNLPAMEFLPITSDV